MLEMSFPSGPEPEGVVLRTQNLTERTLKDPKESWTLTGPDRHNRPVPRDSNLVRSIKGEPSQETGGLIQIEVLVSRGTKYEPSYETTTVEPQELLKNCSPGYKNKT